MLLQIQEQKKCIVVILFSMLFILLLIYGMDIHQFGHLQRRIKSKAINKTKPTRYIHIATQDFKILAKKPSQKHAKVPNFKQYFPNVLLIGVRKGGTRALLRALVLNPNIHTVSKEVHFFDREENYKNGLEWYRKKMPFVSTTAPRRQIIMEKTPAYFVTPKVPERIYNMSKNIKLLVVVRNPTRRAISDYTQLKSKNPLMPPFEQYVTKDKKQKILKVNETCIQIGIYVKHLKNWLKYFPLKQIHFVSGEKLSTDPFPELQAIEEFLGIDPVIKEEYFIFNKTKGFPCFKKQPLNISSTEYSCLGPGKGRKHPEVRQDILQLLMTYYSPYNKQFFKMVSRDFGWV